MDRVQLRLTALLVGAACLIPVASAEAATSISTTASPAFAIGSGGALSDTASVAGLTSQPGGTVTFSLYGPSDPTCAGQPVFTGTSAMTHDGFGNGSASSGSFTPTAVGTYRWIARYNGDANNSPVSGTCGEPSETRTITKTSPSLTTLATPDVALGAGQLSDTATITGLFSAAASTVTLRLYGPSDPTCSGPPVFTSTVPLSVNGAANGGTAQSASFTPAVTGVHRWVATYNGDARNGVTSGVCGEPSETRTVTKATPSLSTLASPDITLGAGQLTDKATLTGLVSPQASAVTFRLYDIADTNCSGQPLLTSVKPLVINGASGTAESSPFTPANAGTYRWRAVYDGDANNTGASSTCAGPSETRTVAKATPLLSTLSSPNVTLGSGELKDVATLTGLVNPSVTNVFFYLYGPSKPTCAGAASFSGSLPLALNQARTGGTAESLSYEPTVAGIHRWVAVYLGDANNNAVSGVCDDPDETRTVRLPTTPTITSVASPGITLGSGTLSDSATVSSLFDPQAATVTFRLYGPGDNSCAGPAVFQDTQPLVVASGQDSGTAQSAQFTPLARGTYRWRATYNGDAGNLVTTGACGEPSETRLVSAANTPQISALATPNIRIGAGQLSNTATVSGLVDPAAGTVTFRIYGPGDAACTGPARSTSVQPLALAGDATSGTATAPDFSPSLAGEYRWVAGYDGDARNNPAPGTCGESRIVARATPKVVTGASQPIPLGGGELRDNAAVTGRVLPQAGATIEFRLYGPDDAICAGPPVFTSSGHGYPFGGGAVASGLFSPSATGTYRWRAFYSGDVNNEPASGACDDPDESTLVSPAPVVTPFPSTTLGRPAAPSGPQPQPGCPLAIGQTIGTAADDTFVGTRRYEIAFGLGGADQLSGEAGRDCLYGGAGDDLLEGDDGDDMLFGGAGKDRLFGGAGSDRLQGEAGADRLSGGTGDDRLFGGAGADEITGGAGVDRFDGGAGNDAINARDSLPRDSSRREIVACGAGRDRVLADAADIVATDCERVVRSPTR